MNAVDFGAWVRPDLVLTLGERTYTVRPPSVASAQKVLAAAVRGEVNLGIVPGGQVPAEVQEVLDSLEPGEHPALGDVYDELVSDGVDPVTIDRMAYYAVFFWARGKGYADALAALLWTPRETPAEGDDADPKDRAAARPTSPRSSGRSTGSGSRSTTTRTASRSSRTTAPPATS